MQHIKQKESTTRIMRTGGKTMKIQKFQYLLILDDEKSGRTAKRYSAKTNKSFNNARISEDLTHLFLLT